MNKQELAFFIAGIAALVIILIVLISCITYYNITQLKSTSDGQPTTTVLYIHRLDDEQFTQLVNLLHTSENKQ